MAKSPVDRFESWEEFLSELKKVRKAVSGKSGSPARGATRSAQTVKTAAVKASGAAASMYDENRTLIYREYTNEKGEIPDIPVVPGNYTFKETYAPEGYALNVAIMDFTVTKDGKVVGPF